MLRGGTGQTGEPFAQPGQLGLVRDLHRQAHRGVDRLKGPVQAATGLKNVGRLLAEGGGFAQSSLTPRQLGRFQQVRRGLLVVASLQPVPGHPRPPDPLALQHPCRAAAEQPPH